MKKNDKNLHSDLYSNSQKLVAIRDGFGEGILELGKENDRVVVLCADLTESTRSLEFAKLFPNRFIETGVAEQNLATVAAGMGISGFIPFIASYATFSPGRNYEQIRTTIAYNDSNVKIIGAHAGLSVGPDGATHQATEDIAIMRVMPNMRVIVPCDANEAKKATIAAGRLYGPVYIRLAREKSNLVTTEETPFIPGRAYYVRKEKNPDIVIVACGIMVYESLIAATLLERHSISVSVINSHTIKPLDDAVILKAAKDSGAILVAEEHQVVGGLGGAVAELLSKNFPVPISFVGLEDVFGESGKAKELLKRYNLDSQSILKSALKLHKRKK